MNIENSVIVITAAGTPSGRALAEYFCQLKAKVALVDTDLDGLQATFNTCLDKSGNCLSFLLASQSPDAVQSIFNEISREFGTVNVLINYWQIHSLPHLLAQDAFTHQQNENLASTLYVFGRIAALNMINKGGEGLIVNIPSLNAVNDDVYDLDYSSNLIKGLTQSWAHELENTNVRVAGVMPSIRHIDKGLHRKDTAINYDMIDGAAYVVENDSFRGRMLETVS